MYIASALVKTDEGMSVYVSEEITKLGLGEVLCSEMFDSFVCVLEATNKNKLDYKIAKITSLEYVVSVTKTFEANEDEAKEILEG